MSKKFLVAVDGSDHSWKALDLASELGKLADVELVIVHVVPYEPMPEGLGDLAGVESVAPEEQAARYHQGKRLGDRIASEAEARARKNGLDRVITLVAEGNAAHEIAETARETGAEMLFVGSRGLGAVGSMLMGSISHKVMHLAPCTCVAVK